ncbi:MAG: HAD-IB family phosphatase, partial [Pseudomonadota bacterium]
MDRANDDDVVLVGVGPHPTEPILLDLLSQAGVLAAGPVQSLAAGAPWHASDVMLAALTETAARDLKRLMTETPETDLALIPAANRRKRFLICDMDSTIIEQECLDELADFAGLKAEIAAITERAMRGELNFEDALRTRVARLQSLPVETIETCFRERITLSPGARTQASNGRLGRPSCQRASGRRG